MVFKTPSKALPLREETATIESMAQPQETVIQGPLSLNPRLIEAVECEAAEERLMTDRP